MVHGSHLREEPCKRDRLIGFRWVMVKSGPLSAGAQELGGLDAVYAVRREGMNEGRPRSPWSPRMPLPRLCLPHDQSIHLGLQRRVVSHERHGAGRPLVAPLSSELCRGRRVVS